MKARRLLAAAAALALPLATGFATVPASATVRTPFDHCDGGDSPDRVLHATLDGEDSRGVSVGTLVPGDVFSARTDDFSILRINWWGTTKDPDGDEGQIAGPGWPAPTLAPYVLMVKAFSQVTKRPIRLDDGEISTTAWRPVGSNSPCYTYRGSSSGRLRFQVNDPKRDDNGGQENITVLVFHRP
ncbi:hypothetical protein [Sphaerisporangium rhizosphaerae]|uniref:Secreted protein n=1 Tax=Sphaerisporangium rhizosphaerae TaxID=2269375 RepID=A0ABW2P765_9ACTN